MRCTGGLARPALTSAFLVQWPAGRCLCAISSGPWEGEFPRRPRKELCAKQQNLCGPPGLLSEPLPGASLSEHHSPPSRFPQQAPRLLLVPVLMVKDTHTKCFLITTFMADAVISLDFTAISFPHRFILSYSPCILPASPEPSPPHSSRLVSTPPIPGRDGKPCRAHCANTHSYSFITFSMRTSTLIKTGPSSLTHFPLPITN